GADGQWGNASSNPNNAGAIDTDDYYALLGGEMREDPPNSGNFSFFFTNPWDIDNDGDGIMDSVWVDLGMPATTTRDGRLAKPLFAILCLDMDGRLNLNAHGSFAHVASEATIQQSAPTSQDHIVGGYATQNISGRGMGYGP